MTRLERIEHVGTHQNGRTHPQTTGIMQSALGATARRAGFSCDDEFEGKRQAGNLFDATLHQLDP